MIKVKCDVKDTLELDELSDFQGNLKERGDAELKKIAPPLKTTYKWLKWGEK